MRKNTRKQRGGNFKCANTPGMSAENTMSGCKMAALAAETDKFNDETMMGGKKIYRRSRKYRKSKKSRKYKRKKSKKSRKYKRRKSR